MAEKAPVFDKIIEDYLNQVFQLNAENGRSTTLEIKGTEQGYSIPLFQRMYSVTRSGIVDVDGKSVHHAVAVLLCKYLLLCPHQPSESVDLVTYKDFRDAAPYVGGFQNTVERPIADTFSQNLAMLEKRSHNLGGQAFATDVSCQLAMRFNALPKVPVVLLFHDADEEFPAKATVLFQKNASSYLDMECLAMVGGILAHCLAGN